VEVLVGEGVIGVGVSLGGVVGLADGWGGVVGEAG
jgi:hypothetical protein